MMTKFTLHIDANVTKLFGFDYGVQLFEEQIGRECTYDHGLAITIPDRVTLISSSFIQGFFWHVVDSIGISGIEKQIQILSSIPNIKQTVVDCLTDHAQVKSGILCTKNVGKGSIVCT